MGTEFKCGCRTSGGAVYPCRYHQMMLGNEFEKVETNQKYLKGIRAIMR
jgi:hypothetical protein